MRRALLIVLLFSAFMTIPAAAQADVCGDSLPPRLTPGREGRVSFTDGRPLNMRLSDHVSASIYTRIPEGDTFDVIGLARCNDGIFWYPIIYVGEKGWIAEAVDGEYLVEPAGGVARLADVLPQDAVLAAQIDGATYALLNRELTPLTEIAHPNDGSFPEVVFNDIAYIRGDTFFVFTGAVVAAHRTSGDPVIFRQPAHNEYTRRFMPSPDGQHVAWLTEVTDPPLTFDACDGPDACGGRDYELYLTDADGTETLLAAWNVGFPYPHAYFQNWIGGEIILEHLMWGVASLIPMHGGGLTSVDDQTGALTEITPLTDSDELLSADGRWLARQGVGVAPVTVENRETGESWTASGTEGNLSGELSFSPSGRYLAYSVFVMQETATSQHEVWIYDTETGENTLLARLDRHPIQNPPPYSYVSAWLSDDLPVLTHGDSFSVVQLSTGATVFIDRVYTALGDEGRPVQRFVGALGNGN
jgi:hypothetical protein